MSDHILIQILMQLHCSLFFPFGFTGFWLCAAEISFYGHLANGPVAIESMGRWFVFFMFLSFLPQLHAREFLREYIRVYCEDLADHPSSNEVLLPFMSQSGGPFPGTLAPVFSRNDRRDKCIQRLFEISDVNHFSYRVLVRRAYLWWELFARPSGESTGVPRSMFGYYFNLQRDAYRWKVYDVEVQGEQSDRVFGRFSVERALDQGKLRHRGEILPYALQELASGFGARVKRLSRQIFSAKFFALGSSFHPLLGRGDRSGYHKITTKRDQLRFVAGLTMVMSLGPDLYQRLLDPSRWVGRFSTFSYSGLGLFAGQRSSRSNFGKRTLSVDGVELSFTDYSPFIGRTRRNCPTLKVPGKRTKRMIGVFQGSLGNELTQMKILREVFEIAAMRFSLSSKELDGASHSGEFVKNPRSGRMGPRKVPRLFYMSRKRAAHLGKTRLDPSSPKKYPERSEYSLRFQ